MAREGEKSDLRSRAGLSHYYSPCTNPGRQPVWPLPTLNIKACHCVSKAGLSAKLEGKTTCACARTHTQGSNLFSLIF